MKIVAKVIKIALFVYFVYSLGVFNAFSASSFVADKSQFRPKQHRSTNEVLTERAAQLSTNINGKEVGYKVFKIYCLNLPSALILFLLWFYQDKKKIKSPVGLMLSVIIYPFVLAKIICKWISVMDNPLSSLDKKYILEAELRRTKSNFFSVISENEVAIIREALTKNISRREFRNKLRDSGLTAKHSFVFALVVTMFLTLLPKTIHAAPDKAPTDKHRVEVSVQVNHIIDDDTGTRTIDGVIAEAIAFVKITLVSYVWSLTDSITTQPILETDYIPW